jgi:hypothetical protein
LCSCTDRRYWHYNVQRRFHFNPESSSSQRLIQFLFLKESFFCSLSVFNSKIQVAAAIWILNISQLYSYTLVFSDIWCYVLW